MDTLQPELYEVLPRASWSRRGFVMTSLVSGFALSMQPVSAETITTDATGLDAAEVKVPTADGEMPAYRAMPASGGPFPTVLVLHEAWGVHEHIKDLCRRFAKLGTTRLRPSFLPGKAMRRRSPIRRSGASSSPAFRPKRRCRISTLPWSTPSPPARPTPSGLPSQGSAGAGSLPGCTRRTTRH
jgi:Dienelactone hydrolase family